LVIRLCGLPPFWHGFVREKISRLGFVKGKIRKSHPEEDRTKGN
jgi:hypothetical protein